MLTPNVVVQNFSAHNNTKTEHTPQLKINLQYRLKVHNANYPPPPNNNKGATKLTLWHEIEDLQKKKAELEFQLRSIEEKEKTLEERARLLEEKLAIQQLEEKLKTKTEAVEKLETKINELEQKLSPSPTIIAAPEPEQNTNSYNLRKLFGEH
jgi:chromosome segregation ATPase